MMFALVRYGARLHDKVATNVLKQKRHSSDGLVVVKCKIRSTRTRIPEVQKQAVYTSKKDMVS